MNAGIILAGKNPNIFNAFTDGQDARARHDQNQRTNALADFYKAEGANVLAGDQNALNGLAQHDPQAALRVQNSHQANARADQASGRADQEFQLRMAEYSKGLSREQAAADAEEIKQGLLQANAFYQNGDLQGLNQMLTSRDIEPLQSLDQYPGVASQYQGILDNLTKLQDFHEGPNPADEYGRYVAEEQAAGRQPLSRIDYKQAGKGKATVVYDPTTGKPLVSIGGGTTDPADASNPSSPAAMISSIDGILNDPALDTATGILEWTQNIPGTGSKRFGARADQLNGQAFLQAFESLKGAGQITEIEGQKATQAIGRLDTAQSPADYRDALSELRGILDIGMQRQKVDGTADETKRYKFNAETGELE